MSARAPAGAPDLPVSWVPVKETLGVMRLMRKQRSVRNAVLGISWFWFVGTVLSAQLPNYAVVHLGAADGNLTVYLLCLALFALFRYTKLGIAMQASSQNQLAAYYMGIPVRRLNGLAWGLAAAVAAIAGLLLAPITFVHANMGFIGLKAFPAAVVGGFGSLPGAIVGGLIIGGVESLSGFYLPDGFKDTAAYIVVLVMLMVQPNGLFGERLRKKV